MRQLGEQEKSTRKVRAVVVAADDDNDDDDETMDDAKDGRSDRLRIKLINILNTHTSTDT